MLNFIQTPRTKKNRIFLSTYSIAETWDRFWTETNMTLAGKVKEERVRIWCWNMVRYVLRVERLGVDCGPEVT